MKVLVLLAVVCVAMALHQYFRVAEDVWGALLNWKVVYRLEFNWKNARARNIAALCLLVPFGLLLGKYVQPLWKCYALLAGYVLVREGVGVLLPMRMLDQEWRGGVRRTLWTYFLPFFAVFLVTSLLGGAFGWEVRAAHMVETALLFLLDFVAVFKILRGGYSLFPTFLYLCALEILPLGVLVAFAA